MVEEYWKKYNDKQTIAQTKAAVIIEQRRQDKETHFSEYTVAFQR